MLKHAHMRVQQQQQQQGRSTYLYAALSEFLTERVGEDAVHGAYVGVPRLFLGHVAQRLL